MAKIIPIGHANILHRFNSAEEIECVLLFYVEMQKQVTTKKTRITENRKQHICHLLRKFTKDELCLVIEYICTSKDNYSTWIRANGYASFSNMFRVKKFADKLKRATEWNNKEQSELDMFNVVHLPFSVGE